MTKQNSKERAFVVSKRNLSKKALEVCIASINDWFEHSLITERDIPVTNTVLKQEFDKLNQHSLYKQWTAFETINRILFPVNPTRYYWTFKSPEARKALLDELVKIPKEAA